MQNFEICLCWTAYKERGRSEYPISFSSFYCSYHPVFWKPSVISCLHHYWNWQCSSVENTFSPKAVREKKQNNSEPSSKMIRTNHRQKIDCNQHIKSEQPISRGFKFLIIFLLMKGLQNVQIGFQSALIVLTISVQRFQGFSCLV